jgi:hypothetical protein
VNCLDLYSLGNLAELSGCSTESEAGEVSAEGRHRCCCSFYPDGAWFM